MKLRYYMRGLGIGMLVAALVLVLSGNTGNKMTDEEIKKRAAELGMVEDTKEVLSETAAETKPESELETVTGTKPEIEPETVTEAEPETVTEAEPETEPETVEETVESQTESDTQEENDIQAEVDQEKKEEVEALKKAAEEVAENAQSLNPNETVTIQVYSGDSSVAVAKRAQAAGLVESAEAFDRFLCQNGYDKSICVGNYQVPKNSTEDEIARIITKK